MARQLIYEKVLSTFPQRNLRMAFAYGSGVFKQQGNDDTSKNMLDFIFVVDDSHQWHADNLKQNKDHYSFLRYLGSNGINIVQDKFGARVYFNTLIPCEERLIKYGVISTDALLNDLFTWETLYIAGRLHKPVYHLKDVDADLDLALQSNVQSAMHAALLLLPEKFKEQDLYEKITGLSYMGDRRMELAEDQNKVRNIVTPNIEKFRELYIPHLKNEYHVEVDESKWIFEQNLDMSSRVHHFNFLPKELSDRIVKLTKKKKKAKLGRDELIRGIAYDCRFAEVISKCVSDIVRSSSTTQSLKGIFTAGLSKSSTYFMEKRKKMHKSPSPCDLEKPSKSDPDTNKNMAKK